MMKKNIDIVEQIHNEIDTAQNRLLNQALMIISMNEVSKDLQLKAERLERVGFINHPSIVEMQEKRNKININNSYARLINYYMDEYPGLKFLTEEEFDRICSKYNLIYAPVANYVKDIPDLNLQDIENAKKLNNRDTLDIVYKYDFNFFNYVPSDARKWFNSQVYKDPDLRDHVLKEICPIKYKGSYVYSNFKAELIDKTGLFIAAPKSHFNLRNLTNKGFGFFHKIVIEPKDPIVFRYVKGGIQVITKWGNEEAKDPNLIIF